MKNVESTLRILARLRETGIALAMDDFGTGYSSLSYLKRFPLDLIKIDYSFVRDLTRDASDAALVRTIIAMARNLNLRSVAEGVETAEQLAFLRRNGCDTVQGFYFSPPVPAEEFIKLFRSAFPWPQTGDQAPVPRAE
jgi:EAL domain-containing protein (putative c-di-GMP-specific phosphodiesterase class I)